MVRLASSQNEESMANHYLVVLWTESVKGTNVFDWGDEGSKSKVVRYKSTVYLTWDRNMICNLSPIS